VDSAPVEAVRRDKEHRTTKAGTRSGSTPVRRLSQWAIFPDQRSRVAQKGQVGHFSPSG
jgi:hypothetical protein